MRERKTESPFSEEQKCTDKKLVLAYSLFRYRNRLRRHDLGL